MNLPELSVKRSTTAWVIMAALLLFGMISFFRLGISRLPDVDFPAVSINARLPNAAPEIMETDVADIIESSLMTIQGIRSVSSSCRRGSASITVEFELDIDINIAQQEIQSKIFAVQRRLPRDMDPPSISKSNPEDEPIMMLSLESADISRPELMTYVRDSLRDEITRIEGVGDVTMMGYYEPNLRIWVSPEALSHYSLTALDIMNTLSRESLELPAGIVPAGKNEYSVRTLGEVRSLSELQNLLITSRGGGVNFAPVPLSRLARVEKGTEDIRNMSRAMGKQAVGMGILKQRGVNEVSVARLVKKEIAEIQKRLPPGMELAVNMDRTTFTEESVNDMIFTIILATIFTSLVCWLFLGTVSSTLNILVTIPFSVIGSFVVIYFLGFTLNTFTLMALSLVIGVVVDDAIMVLENITRYFEKGMKKREAALKGSGEIMFAALAATVAIISIFLPVAFMTGVIGRFFFQFGVTLSVAVALSLLGALTVTPMLSSKWLAAESHSTLIGRAFEKLMDLFKNWYAKILPLALAHRWTVLAGAGLIFALSLIAIIVIPKEFTPSVDESRFALRIQTPVGSSLEYTDEKVREAEALLLKRPEIERLLVFVGGRDVNFGRIMVMLKHKGKRGRLPGAKRDMTQNDVMEYYRKLLRPLKEMRITVQDFSAQNITASRGYPVEFAIQGPDWEKLSSLSHAMMDEMEKSGLLTDVNSDYREGAPEIEVVPDRSAAAARGVNVSSIAEVLNMMIGGLAIGTYTEGGRRFDIRIKIEEKGQTKNPEELIKKLYVRNNYGELIRLSQIVSVRKKKALLSINRLNRQRAITVTANVLKGKSQEKALQTVQDTAKKILPAGYYITISGSARTFRESFSGLFFILILGVTVAAMVLSVQFNSFTDPFIILMALPFSVTGAFTALLLFRQSLNIFSMIGIILLMGIVKKNSILLVEFANRIRETEKLPVNKALLKACPIRLRPILMTAVSTLAGALPVAFAIGPGAESRVSMGVAVIGGLLFSTILTLFVVPCVYSLMGRRKQTALVS